MTVTTESNHVATEPDDDVHIGDLPGIIEMRRRVIGISKAELARRVDSNKVSVTNFLNGKVDIASSTAWKMMEVMGAEVRWSAGF